MVSLREEGFRDAIPFGSEGKDGASWHGARIEGLPLRVDCDNWTISKADLIDPAHG
jgi:hypothetical protein